MDKIAKIQRQAIRALESLRRFVHEAQKDIEMPMRESFRKDDGFLLLVEEAVKKCDPEMLSETLNVEFLGLSHYFCSYCNNQKKLNALIDFLYDRVKDLYLEARKV